MKTEVIEKLASLITAAFGLIAALAWNEAIQSIFKKLFGDSSSILAMLAYASIVTIVAVFVTLQLGSLAEQAKDSGRKV